VNLTGSLIIYQLVKLEQSCENIALLTPKGEKMKTKFAVLVPAIVFTVTGTAFAAIAGKPANADNFYASDKLIVQKVLFLNQYGMNIAGNLK
jgi:hypothetical protein